MTGTSLYAYCGYDPINRVDPTGEAWWHWALGALVVAACAVAVVATAGGAAAGIAAVAAVGNGMAAATTASTIAAGAFIGSATVYGMAALDAATSSNSIKEFNSKGNWGTVAATVGGAVAGGASAYVGSKSSSKVAKSKASTKSSGTAFKTGQRNGTTQVGVDPNTLKINRPILEEKIKAIKLEAQKNGGINRPVEVYSNGLVYDGNHRVEYARRTGGSVDTFVIFQ